MNCPQCQTPNQQDSAFCANCGTPLPAAQAASSGYMPPPGQGTPVGYSAPSGYGAPSEYGPSGTAAPANQYPPAGQQPAGGYQQPAGQYQPRQGTVGSPISFDLKRLTRTDQIVGVATLIAMISIWLPWYSVSGDGLTLSFDATSWGHGWMWLEFVVALALLGYLALRAGSSSPPRLPIAHAPLLLIGTLVQLLLIVLAFALIPYGDQGMGWDWAAFVGLLAALVAAAPLAVPAAQQYMQTRQ